MLIAPLADNHQVGNVEGGFLWQDSTFNILLWIRLGVFMNVVYSFHHCLIFIQVYL
jgi:hypothetical protein